MTVVRIVVIALAAICLDTATVRAQDPNVTRERLRDQVNENALFLMGGPLGQSDIAYAADIASVVDDGMNLRVLPVVGAAAAQNVKDVLFLRGVDLALTDAATMTALLRADGVGQGLARQIAYVSVLYTQEVHILTRSDINTIEDLRGKKVNFDIAGSGSALNLPDLFQRLGVEVLPSNMAQPDAVEALRRGDIDATACICAKPVGAFQSVTAQAGFKLLGLPYTDAIEGHLLPSSIGSDDYPGLVQQQSAVETVATTAVLISFNWPKGSPRYVRTAKFVDAFFSKFSELLKPPRQNGWRTVNLAATLPGWQRFVPAQQWLDVNSRNDAVVRAEFAKYAAERGVQNPAEKTDENDGLFREFLEQRSKPN